MMTPYLKRLAKISPKWAKALAKNPRTTIIENKHSLEDYGCCIVGEAYGFSDKYEGRCDTCARLADEFACAIYDETPEIYTYAKTKRQLKEVSDEFTAHWKKEHN